MADNPRSKDGKTENCDERAEEGDDPIPEPLEEPVEPVVWSPRSRFVIETFAEHHSPWTVEQVYGSKMAIFEGDVTNDYFAYSEDDDHPFSDMDVLCPPFSLKDNGTWSVYIPGERDVIFVSRDRDELLDRAYCTIMG